MLDLAIVTLGGVLLYFGAAGLTSGAAGIAGRFGISPLVVGLSVVSCGSNAPELAVSLSAAAAGQSPIVLGNVIGSNIANIGLILGLTALIAPPKVDPLLFRREVPYLLIATLAAGPVLLNGHIDRAEAALFLVSGLAFIAVTFHWAKDERRRAPAQSAKAGSEEPLRGPTSLAILLLLGVLGLYAGGRLLVAGALGLARDLGVSERVIALTVVTLGTSLPELATCVVAALRGQSDIAVGSVVGSNLFNILFVLGLTGLVTPVAGRLTEVRVDLIAMTLLTLFMAASLHKARSITRTEGALYLVGYLGFLVALVLTR